MFFRRIHLGKSILRLGLIEPGKYPGNRVGSASQRVVFSNRSPMFSTKTAVDAAQHLGQSE